MKFKNEGKLIELFNSGDVAGKTDFVYKKLLGRLLSAADGWYVYDKDELIVSPGYIAQGKCSGVIPDSYGATLLVINRCTRQNFGQTYGTGFWIASAIGMDILTSTCYWHDLLGTEISGSGLKEAMSILSEHTGMFKSIVSLTPLDWDNLAAGLQKRSYLFKNRLTPYPDVKFDAGVKIFEKLYFNIDDPSIFTPDTEKEIPCGAKEIPVVLLSDGAHAEIRPVELGWIIGGGYLYSSEKTPVTFSSEILPDVANAYLQNGLLYLTPRLGFLINIDEICKRTKILRETICVHAEVGGVG